MSIVMGLDQHRAQITADWLDTETGEVRRGRVAPADRAGVRGFLERLAFLADCLHLPAATGSFTSGGAGANLTAVLVALERHFPEATEQGLGGVAGQPTLYVSAAAHHSFVKAAGMTGLGHAAVRSIPVTDDLILDVEALRSTIARDGGAARRPFLVVATAGSTAAGVIDPCPR